MTHTILANFAISDHDESEQTFVTSEGQNYSGSGVHQGVLRLLKPAVGFEFLAVVRSSVYVWAGSPRKESTGVFVSVDPDSEGDPNYFLIRFQFTGADTIGGGMGGAFTAAFTKD